MSHTERLLAREKLIETLEQMLVGELSFIEGSRVVTGLTDKAGYDRLVEPFVKFVAIDSETDAIPVGEVRELWQPDAIAKHTDDWNRSEAWARQVGQSACEEALALLS
jgi:hypothetical protein